MVQEKRTEEERKIGQKKTGKQGACHLIQERQKTIVRHLWVIQLDQDR